MKLRTLFLSIITGIMLVFPVIASAQLPSQLVPCENDCQACHIVAVGQNIIQFIAFASFALAALIFVFAGIKYLIALGDEGAIREAGSMMTNAVVGIIIIFASWIIVNTVLVIFLDSGDGTAEIGTMPWNSVTCVSQPEPTPDDDPGDGVSIPPVGSGGSEDLGICPGCVDMTTVSYNIPVKDTSGSYAQIVLASALSDIRLNPEFSQDIEIPGVVLDTVDMLIVNASVPNYTGISCYDLGSCVDFVYTGPGRLSMDKNADTAVAYIGGFFDLADDKNIDAIYKVPTEALRNSILGVINPVTGAPFISQDRIEVSSVTEPTMYVFITAAPGSPGSAPPPPNLSINPDLPSGIPIIGVVPGIGGVCRGETPSGPGVILGSPNYPADSLTTFWTYVDLPVAGACTWTCASGYLKTGTECYIPSVAPPIPLACGEPDPPTGKNIPVGVFIAREESVLVAGQTVTFDVVVMEAESGTGIGGSWVVGTDTDWGIYTGSGYLRWTGSEYFSSADSAPNEISYRFWITEPGEYELRMRGSHQGAPADDLNNDVWSLFDQATVDGISGWVKTGHGAGGYTTGFTFHTLYEPTEFASPRWNLTAGEHVFKIRPRSKDFRIDRIHFHNSQGTTADIATLAESIKGTGEEECSTLPPSGDPGPSVDPGSFSPADTSEMFSDVSSNAIWVSQSGGSELNTCAEESKPCKTIAAGMGKMSSGKALIIKEGEYREIIKPTLSNITILGYPGDIVVINGSVLAPTSSSDPAWTNLGSNKWSYNPYDDGGFSLWEAPGTSFFISRGFVAKWKRPEIVVVDDSVLGTAYTEAELGPGKIWRDGTSQDPKELIIQFPDNKTPSDFSKIEIGKHPVLFDTWGNAPDDLTVAGLRFKIAPNSMDSDSEQNGAVTFRGDNYTIHDITVILANGGGISITGSGHVVTDARANFNGHKGFDPYGLKNSRITNCEAIGNNWKNYDPRWAAGGMKFVSGVNDNIIEDCYFKDNDAPGLWGDIFNDRNVFQRITVINNEVAGIFVEHNTDDNVYTNSIIYGTRLDQNILFPSQWAGIGLKMAAVADNDVSFMTIYGNEGDGILFKWNDDRGANKDNIIRDSIIVNNGADSPLHSQTDYEINMTCDDGGSESDKNTLKNLVIQNQAGGDSDRTFSICGSTYDDAQSFMDDTGATGITLITEPEKVLSDPDSPTGYSAISPYDTKGADYSFTYR